MPKLIKTLIQEKPPKTYEVYLPTTKKTITCTNLHKAILRLRRE